jgi:hypothetical protein
MTEYEIADLAASRAFELQGAVSLLQTQTTNITEAIQQYMSILFGYMAAAYFIGENLGRRQVRILTTLYVMWQAWIITIVVAKGLALGLILEALQELQDSTLPILGMSLVLRITSTGLLITVLFASLYFMWSVRHPETE